MSDYWEKNGLTKPQEIIVCAANRLEDGTLLCGARHWDKAMRAQADAMNLNCGSNQIEQGFINQFCEFRTRKEALKIVKENGQPFDAKRNVASDELYSEGLY